jgi:hypothetical protein
MPNATARCRCRRRRRARLTAGGATRRPCAPEHNGWLREATAVMRPSRGPDRARRRCRAPCRTT